MDVGGNRQICLNLLCINVMHLTIQQRVTGKAEGVGFEPTVRWIASNACKPTSRLLYL